MKKERVYCPKCGEVKIKPKKITLRYCCNCEWLHFYTFECPKCHRPASNRLYHRLVPAMVKLGAQAEFWWMPTEPKETKVGEPLTEADADALTELLNQPDWLEKLKQAIRPDNPRSS